MRSDGASTARPERSVAPVLSAVAAFGAIVVVVLSGLSTSSARIAATTDSNGFLSTATIAIDAESSSTELLFDAENLYPGVEIIGCVAFEYSGSAPVELRMASASDGGTGLDEFIEIRLTARPAGICPALASVGNDGGGELLFDGRLRAFWQTHDSFTSGVPVTTMSAGDVVAVDAVITMIDDDDAAGRDVQLSFSFEGRAT